MYRPNHYFHIISKLTCSYWLIFEVCRHVLRHLLRLTHLSRKINDTINQTLTHNKHRYTVCATIGKEILSNVNAATWKGFLPLILTSFLLCCKPCWTSVPVVVFFYFLSYMSRQQQQKQKQAPDF